MNFRALLFFWFLTVASLSVLSNAALAQSSQDVRYYNGTVELAAELMVPSAEGPRPAVVIAQGALYSDRTNRWSREVAYLFRDSGYVVLLTDKRGSGQSGGDWRSTAFEDLAQDVIAGVRLLQAHGRVDPTRVGIVGLSQSGRYVPLAATRAPDIAFVVSISSDTVSFLEQSLHEMANVARQNELSAAGVQAIVDLNLQAAHYLLSGEWEPYGTARAQALQQPWGAVAQGFPATPDAPVWEFLRLNSDFNPMAYWPAVRQPVFVMLGIEDERDNVAVRESVDRLQFGFALSGKTNYTIAVIPEAGHDAGLLSDGPALEQSRAALTAFITSLP